MTKDQAKQKAKEALYTATMIFEDLVREGRLSKDGNESRQEELLAVRKLREQWGNEAAEFIEEYWVSFDGQPTAAELEAAVEQDERGSGDSDEGGEGEDKGGEDSGESSDDSAEAGTDNEGENAAADS